MLYLNEIYPIKYHMLLYLISRFIYLIFSDSVNSFLLILLAYFATINFCEFSEGEKDDEVTLN